VLFRAVVQRPAIHVEDRTGSPFAQPPRLAHVRENAHAAHPPHLFFDHVVQDAAIERQIGDDLLEPRVLFAQLEILSKAFPLLVLSLWRSRS
jgi:hypothetical protein